MKSAPQIQLSSGERSKLERLSKSRMSEVRLAQRTKIILLAAEGLTNKEIAQQMNTTPNTVGRWRRRFAVDGLKGIQKELPRGGRPRQTELDLKIIHTVTQTQPKDATHWSVRTLAAELNVSRSRVHRVLSKANLQPHRYKNFKVSNDPQFAEKLVDVIGLYLDPPDKALVLCVDEKSQIQALDRTQKSLPMYPGRCGTLTHDYKRNGTTTLFAALNMADGKVIGSCMERHRHQEFLKFLKIIDKETPAELDLHLIVDNYCTHKHEKVKRWLKRNKRFHLHFTPTSSSWLNMVERWFGELTRKRIRRGVFRSVKELETAILNYLETHNQKSKPYIWTAKTEDILEKVKRAKKVLENVN